MTSASETSPPEQSRAALRVEWLCPANRDRVLTLTDEAWDRSRSAASRNWRYEHCPGLEAAVALSGDDCVACVFGIRRTYWTRDGDVDCVEPFDWFTREEWRPRGAGLRVMKHLMTGPRPLIAMGGSEAARKLFLRLGWTHFATAERLFLPLTGRFLVSRGRSSAVAAAFDLLGRPLYVPRRRRLPDALRMEPGTSPGPRLNDLIERQRRFALMARPSLPVIRWLHEVPPEMGCYLGFNVVVDGEMVGWARVRLFTADGVRLGELQHLFLADHAVAWYGAAIRHLLPLLAGFGLDAIYAATSCPDTLSALRAHRFRRHHDLPLYWWSRDQAAPASALITGVHAEYAFFPAANARESAWARSG